MMHLLPVYQELVQPMANLLTLRHDRRIVLQRFKRQNIPQPTVLDPDATIYSTCEASAVLPRHLIHPELESLYVDLQLEIARLQQTYRMVVKEKYTYLVIDRN